MGGIDGIGKGGLPPVGTPEGAGAAPMAGAVERPFSLEGADEAGGAGRAAAVEVDPTTPLGRLRAGEIDVEGYADLKVDEATKGLEGISAAELDDIKKLLRDQITTDPGLGDLVHTATGQAPRAVED